MAAHVANKITVVDIGFEHFPTTEHRNTILAIFQERFFSRSFSTRSLQIQNKNKMTNDHFSMNTFNLA